MIHIEVWLMGASLPVEYEARNAYVKEGFYCVFSKDEKVYKYPIGTIFRVVEEYRAHQKG